MDKDLLEKFNEYENEIHEKEVKLYTRMAEEESEGRKKREYSQAQNKATQKYIKNNYDEIKVRVPKGKREEYKVKADVEGKSLNQFIVDCIEEKM